MKRESLALMREAAVPRRYRLRVQERLLVLEYASANGVRPASRRFGFTSRTIRRWRVRWRADGVRGPDPAVPGPPTAPDSGEPGRPHPACARRLRLPLDADPALALACPPAPRLADDH